MVVSHLDITILWNFLYAALPMGLGLAAIARMVEASGVVQRVGMVILGVGTSVLAAGMFGGSPWLWVSCWVLLADLVILSFYRGVDGGEKLPLWQLFLFITLAALLMGGLRGVLPAGRLSVDAFDLLVIAYGGYIAAVVSVLVFQPSEEHPIKIWVLTGLFSTMFFSLSGALVFLFAMGYLWMSCVCAVRLLGVVSGLRAQCRPVRYEDFEEAEGSGTGKWNV